MRAMRVVWPIFLVLVSFYLALWSWGRYAGLYDPSGHVILKAWVYTLLFYGIVIYAAISLVPMSFFHPRLLGFAIALLTGIATFAFFNQARAGMRAISAQNIGTLAGVAHAKVLIV